ncbi:GerAB/ArcD/ProY family transporter [Paenibacillus sp. PL91]|uniref:GerAB/ArcD/ProY family transporter n=1 Tax=Paenibacillus sp. PL91 TaxID=2729538 RepID=UPI00145F37B0|nr:GerAB/ArcD/ProY family transporter [Paenibacillus sp. PL91]MBC9204543.1 GerAB/ArcD/ProY family transporter [Paenibacillus sp. PL91]
MTNKMTMFQSYSLMLVLLLGTSILFGTPKLVPDVWLVQVITVVPALLLFLLYTTMVSTESPKGLYALLVAAWGNLIGKAFVLCYTIYFLYIAARNVRDMLELVMTTLLRTTPQEIVVVLFVLVIAYATYGGMLALGRLSEVIIGLIFLFFIAIAALLLMSGSLDLHRMLPFLSKGIVPVIKTSIESSLWFPYGELIVFLVLCPRMGGKSLFRKAGVRAVISAGIILAFSDLLQIWSMGMEYEKYSTFPLLDAARLINVLDFINRMDALVALITIFGVFLKCTIFLYAGAKGVSVIFRRASRTYIYPLAMLIGAMSIIVTQNFAEHSEEGLHFVVYFLHIPFQFVLPLLTGALIWIRSNRKGGNASEPIKPTFTKSDG